MSTIPFPNEPQKRRVILVLSPYEYERLQYERWGHPLLLDALNGKVYILIPSEVDQQNPIVEALIQKGLDNEGTFLLQNPCDFSDYEDVNKAFYTFALSKWSHFIIFCDYLGVKNVSIEQVEIISSSNEEIHQGGISAASGQVDAEMKNNLDSFNQVYMRIGRTLPENERDTEKAVKYFRQHLASDPFIKSLLDLRSKGSYELEFNLTQEIKRNLNIAVSLQMPKLPGDNIYKNAQANISRVLRESHEFKLGIKIQF